MSNPTRSPPTAVRPAVEMMMTVRRRNAANICGRALRRQRLFGGPRAGAPHLLGAHRPALERVVARRHMAVAERVERRVLDVAVALDEARTAGMEVTRARRVHRARDVALEHDRLALTAELGVRDRHR